MESVESLNPELGVQSAVIFAPSLRAKCSVFEYANCPTCRAFEGELFLLKLPNVVLGVEVGYLCSATT